MIQVYGLRPDWRIQLYEAQTETDLQAWMATTGIIKTWSTYLDKHHRIEMLAEAWAIGAKPEEIERFLHDWRLNDADVILACNAKGGAVRWVRQDRLYRVQVKRGGVTYEGLGSTCLEAWQDALAQFIDHGIEEAERQTHGE